jgi:hypothetical protein
MIHGMNLSRHLGYGKDAQTLLRFAMLCNATFSTLSGAGLLLLPNHVIAIAGLPLLHIRSLLGCGLLGYAAWLGSIAFRPNIKLADAHIVVVMDVAWTVVSIPVAILSSLTSEGRWLVATVAAAVLLFAVLQRRGIQIVRGNSVETKHV